MVRNICQSNMVVYKRLCAYAISTKFVCAGPYIIGLACANAQTSKSLCCSCTQSMDVHDGLDQHSDL